MPAFLNRCPILTARMRFLFVRAADVGQYCFGSETRFLRRRKIPFSKTLQDYWPIETRDSFVYPNYGTTHLTVTRMEAFAIPTTWKKPCQNQDIRIEAQCIHFSPKDWSRMQISSL